MREEKLMGTNQLRHGYSERGESECCFLEVLKEIVWCGVGVLECEGLHRGFDGKDGLALLAF
ncbi:hypothetical protein CEXT_396191, partial [Caerostris extrusa]